MSAAPCGRLRAEVAFGVRPCLLEKAAAGEAWPRKRQAARRKRQAARRKRQAARRKRGT